MKRITDVAVTLLSHTLFVLLMTAIGLVFGGFIGVRHVERLPLREPWQPLGSPGPPVERLLQIDWGDLYVVAADDRVYRCCWERSETPEFPTNPPSHFPCEVSQEKPVAPGPVADRLETTYCGPDYGVTYAYLLLEDGTVWKWSYAGGGLAGIGVILASLCLGVGGLLFGAVIAVRSWRDRREQWRRPPQAGGAVSDA